MVPRCFRVSRVGLVLLALFAAAPQAAADDVLVFAAASLKNALDAAAHAYEQRSGDRIQATYAASSALARQIENGAPAQIFISADLDWMNNVAKKGLIEPATREDFLGNKLVLIVPAASTAAKVAIVPHFPLAELIAGGRLAMADPDAVPAGKYGKAALETLGVWDSVAKRLARAEDVRAALRFVSRGETPYGIVYATDAAADTGVRIAGTFPANTYPPIIYPMAALKRASPAALKFIAYLHSTAARPWFEKQGFAVLE
ncbi:MAG TPA: molybdate ABC transporter substrate-binding protein [Stellaceae bacterium]|nr:molybdate ABC transporter substrate-binding protein [Stellaceae bacterium]